MIYENVAGIMSSFPTIQCYWHCFFCVDTCLWKLNIVLVFADSKFQWNMLRIDSLLTLWNSPNLALLLPQLFPCSFFEHLLLPGSYHFPLEVPLDWPWDSWTEISATKSPSLFFFLRNKSWIFPPFPFQSVIFFALVVFLILLFIDSDFSMSTILCFVSIPCSSCCACLRGSLLCYWTAHMFVEHWLLGAPWHQKILYAPKVLLLLSRSASTADHTILYFWKMPK